MWFVNFYSPQCHHCHELAPTWRRIAKEFQGIIRIAAVNCEDDWSLCYQLGISSYPTLMFYKKEANLHEGERYKGHRNFEDIEDFILTKIPSIIAIITPNNWLQKQNENSQWLLFICSENTDCVESKTQIKLAAALEGLVTAGVVLDEKLAKKIDKDFKNHKIIYWKKEEGDNVSVQHVQGSDCIELMENILNLLPRPELIDEGHFEEIRNQLREGSTTPWLLCFHVGSATDLDLQLKRLPSLLPNINIGLVHCAKSSSLCSTLHISRYPTWGVLKVGGAFEIHHGRDIMHDIITFARDSVRSTNMRALTPEEYEQIRKTDDIWFIDWFAPWCPPCKKLLPELRRASQHFDKNTVQFGTIDCTLHRNLCTREGITAYPTTILYNGNTMERFHGVPNEDGIVNFIDDTLNSKVISLDDSSFVKLMRKPVDEIWFVDFFAPWCGPCQKLSLTWRKLAKQMSEFPQLKIAQIDCVSNAALCSSQNIKAYPTLRLFPLGSKGLNSVIFYTGNWELVTLKRWLLSLIPSPVIELKQKEFNQKILKGQFDKPWLIDFFAPWCGHCVHFDPEFRKVAKELEGYVNCGKVDCQAENNLCRSLQINAYPSVILFVSESRKYEISSRNFDEIIRKVNLLVDHHRSQEFHDEL
ncbi:dnaJ homolog subfamily C member 10-like isoform X2 [Coccinella septempunctata]|nr:dnaJ homolog subfamily C member 10-like isoform X2 [Coccinella septempunctata]